MNVLKRIDIYECILTVKPIYSILKIAILINLSMQVAKMYVTFDYVIRAHQNNIIISLRLAIDSLKPLYIIRLYSLLKYNEFNTISVLQFSHLVIVL